MSTKEHQQQARLPRRILSIAGSDSGGSAGIQADLKTYEAHGVFGCTAITAVTAQNTVGVQAGHALPEAFISQQIASVLDDIGADAIKTGLLVRESVIQLVVEAITKYGIEQVVVDPVMIDGYGKQFVSAGAVAAYRERLFPLATVITPNLDEAAVLTGLTVLSQADLFAVAKRLHEFGAHHVVVKGGHLTQDAAILDLVYDGETFTELRAERLPIQNPHGVGCTFASAIAANLALGQAPLAAIQAAHTYLQNALRASLGWTVGAGRSPVNHALR